MSSSKTEEKVTKVAEYLPPNKDIFVASAEFETVQEVPEEIKLKYFNDNLKEIARMLVEAVYKEKEADDIDEVDVITDLEEWLSSGEIKFKLRQNEMVKNENVERPERKSEVIQKSQESFTPQQNVSPKMEHIQNHQQQQTQNGQSTTFTQPYPQSRPQSYYQTPPPQGRQNTIKYTPKLPEMPHLDLNLQAKEQFNVKKAQYEKQNVAWIDSLSKCLTYPEKRFYLLPEMHPKRKY